MTRQLLLAAVLLAFALPSSALAQPRIIEVPADRMPYIPPLPPWQAEEIRARMKDEVELMEAQFDTKKEYLKSAEIGLDVAKRRLAGLGNGASAREMLDARTEVELAQALLNLRKVEIREAEVRIKVAKRRVDSGVFPLVLTPVPSSSIFPPASWPRKSPDDVATLTAKIKLKYAQVEKASAALALARADFDRTKAQVDKGIAPQANLDAAAAKLKAAEADLKAAVADAAAADAELKQATPPVGIALPPDRPQPNPNPQPQSKLPASVGFPTAQNQFALAQVDYEVANLRFELAQVEMQQLQKLGTTGAEMDAAKARYAEAKIGLTAAEDKVLKAQKKIDPFGK